MACGEGGGAAPLAPRQDQPPHPPEGAWHAWFPGAQADAHGGAQVGAHHVLHVHGHPYLTPHDGTWPQGDHGEEIPSPEAGCSRCGGQEGPLHPPHQHPLPHRAAGEPGHSP